MRMNDLTTEVQIALPLSLLFLVQTSFSDLAPLLVLSESAMEVLNSKLDKEMEIERFRPNIILKDCPPHAEVLPSLE